MSVPRDAEAGEEGGQPGGQGGQVEVISVTEYIQGGEGERAYLRATVGEGEGEGSGRGGRERPCPRDTAGEGKGEGEIEGTSEGGGDIVERDTVGEWEQGVRGSGGNPRATTGEGDRAEGGVVRIVHVSDTHRKHMDYIDCIPGGDILIHSGDFTNHFDTLREAQKLSDEQLFRQEIAELNRFFSAVPHRYKIFVGGNHDTVLAKFSPERIAGALSSATYLQDSGVTLLGLRVYGSPRTYYRGMGFPVDKAQRSQFWAGIPGDTDILVTHLPPLGILDLGLRQGNRVQDCDVCGAETHPLGREHSGCAHIKHHVLNRVRPLVHLYGHVHEEHDIVRVDGVVFSNAAMDKIPQANVIDIPVTSCIPSKRSKRQSDDDIKKKKDGDREGGVIPSPPPPPPPELPASLTPGGGQTQGGKPASVQEYFQGRPGAGEEGVRPPIRAVVGEAGPGRRRVTIVHISDTHGRHRDYLPLIPPGDILIHSGDFTNHHSAKRTRETGASDDDIFKAEMREMNDFFSALPHKYKIFVAGNHETLLYQYRKETIEGALHSAVYLQDSAVTALGLVIYGAPWTYCRGMGFPVGRADPDVIWGRIPRDCDVLVTHLPPHGVMDLAYSGRGVTDCDVCGAKLHVNRAHWGCAKLKQHVLNRVKPKLHLFGHVHEEHDVKMVDGVTFSNASMDLTPVPNVIEIYLPPDDRRQHVEQTTRQAQTPVNEKSRAKVKGKRCVLA